MIEFSTAATFASLAFLMALSPGPNLMYLASRAICQGRSAGFASLAGVCAGMLAYVIATALGLSAIFQAVPVVYDIVRALGAGYLVWLAIKAFRAPAKAPGTATLAPEAFAVLFRRGLLTCLLNPKLVLMYGAMRSIGAPTWRPTSPRSAPQSRCDRWKQPGNTSKLSSRTDT